MRKQECPRCGLVVAASHRTAEDCLAHLAPRYALAQRAMAALHRRYRSLEERLERAKIQERIARKEAKRAGSVLGLQERLERIERLIEVA
jgi:hypothetical protein